MMEIKTEIVSIDDQAILQVMLDEYFSEMFELQKLTKDEIAALGSYPFFNLYWQEPDRVPYFILDGQSCIGFALVILGEPNQIAEFFVLPKFRRQRVGQAAAAKIIKQHSGAWQIAVMEENQRAHMFCQTVIASIVGEVFEIKWSDSRPKGPKFTFST